MTEKTILVDYIARVEGQGALKINIEKYGKIKTLEFQVYEPPRFFESFMIGRKYNEVMEIASRICGICPVAHQITALRAVENALGLEPSNQVKDLRKLMAISAHIQSNVLSMYFLSLPDLMGYESVIAMLKDHSEIVKLARFLVSAGYAIVVGRGYFCIEIPLEGGRDPAVYCGDQESIDKFTGCGLKLVDIQQKKE